MIGMRNPKNIVRRLNSALSKSGSNTNPSLTNLILHGPIDKRIISSDNLKILKKNEGKIRKFYNTDILPKIENLIVAMTRGGIRLSNGHEGLSGYFSKKSPEVIRRKLRASYGGQFALDEITAAALFSEERMPYEYAKWSKHSFSKGSNHMVSYRHKETESIISKLKTNFAKLTDGGEINFWDFVMDAAENNYSYLCDFRHYREKYGKKVTDMLPYDLFGVKIVEMSQKKSEENMEYLVDKGLSIDFRHFDVVDIRDHRDRNEECRPGGVHYTLKDKAFRTYPVEVQFRSIKDECFNLVGKKCSRFYEGHGKKACPDFSD